MNVLSQPIKENYLNPSYMNTFMDKIGINIVIEREKTNSGIIFIASSPDINVFAEGKDIDEVRRKFIWAVKHHFETFPEERPTLIKKKNFEFEMPLIQRIFL